MLRITPSAAVLTLLLCILGVVTLLNGCESVRANVGPRVADAVNRYCLEPLAERQTIRTEVNGLIKPNAIRVTCAGDPAEGTP